MTRKKYTLENMQNIALERGGWCLSTTFLTVNDKHWWQCGEGHIWSAPPNNVKNNNSWCGKCADIESAIKRRGYNIEDMHVYQHRKYQIGRKTSKLFV